MNNDFDREPTSLAVIGLGNMGVSVAAVALRRGFRVVAMDIDANKVAMTDRGQCVVPEPGIAEVFTEARRDDRLIATTSLEQTIATTDVCFIAIPTPPDDRGDINYRMLTALLEDMRTSIAARNRRYDIVLGSTVFPGVTRNELLPSLAPLQTGREYQLAVSPVFLRAGSGMADYLDPGRIVVGLEGEGQEGIRAYFARLFPGRSDIWFVDFDTAECVKAVHNAWMSMKVVFANETGQWCRSAGVDGRRVMDIVLSDSKRLLSRSHLNPGPPYSGPCLPKDALALRRQLQMHGLSCPLFEAVHQSNVDYKQRLFDSLLEEPGLGFGVGVLGVSFKPDFNELRWSIASELLRLARGQGFEIYGYDRAFVGCDRDEFLLACRGAKHLHSLFDVVRMPLTRAWSGANRIFLNMNLTNKEWTAIASLQRANPQPRKVVDVYGGPCNMALADLPGVTYHGAAWEGGPNLVDTVTRDLPKEALGELPVLCTAEGEFQVVGQ
ncbi:MAG: nucleotide sugar dehydrogenase [Planctomycetota bacterium]|jgi:GDP-mannose 6-dehydrogenase